MLEGGDSLLRASLPQYKSGSASCAGSHLREHGLIELSCRSGIPSMVLKTMNVNFMELAGCDLNESSAQACLVNTDPGHFFKTVESMLGR